MAITKEEIIGATEVGSQKANVKLEIYDRAKNALEKADAVELFALYEKSIIENNKLVDALAGVVNHYVGTSKQPRYEPPSNAVDAMKEVALAAVRLARDVSIPPADRGV